jgi:hypothetical protein
MLDGREHLLVFYHWSEGPLPGTGFLVSFDEDDMPPFILRLPKYSVFSPELGLRGPNWPLDVSAASRLQGAVHKLKQRWRHSACHVCHLCNYTVQQTSGLVSDWDRLDGGRRLLFPLPGMRLVKSKFTDNFS